MDFTQLADYKTIWMIVIITIIFLWLICIILVTKDISARTNSYGLQIISILLVTFLTPIIWLPIYRAIRPIWYKRDKMPWREACMAQSIYCLECWALNPKEYKCCIRCGKKLQIKCKECNKEFPHSYHYCPDCWAPNIKA
jgi:hypothetical protein